MDKVQLEKMSAEKQAISDEILDGIFTSKHSSIKEENKEKDDQPFKLSRSISVTISGVKVVEDQTTQTTQTCSCDTWNGSK